MLTVERPVRYSFAVRKSQLGWRISSQSWLGKGSARVRALEDKGAAELEVPDIWAIPHQRPTFELVKSVVEARASSMRDSYKDGSLFLFQL